MCQAPLGSLLVPYLPPKWNPSLFSLQREATPPGYVPMGHMGT